MEQITIRKIVESDRESIKHFTDSMKLYYSESEIAQIKKDIVSLEGYIADEESNCLGFILFSRVNQNTGKIHWFLVSLDNLEQGIAPMILKRVEREFLKKRVQKILVETKPDSVVSEKDLLLRQFYRSHEFKDREMKSSDNLILEKWLF